MPRIVVAEDSHTQAVLIRFHLQKAGFEVRVAGDGVEALAAVAAAPPDLVLTDMQMPNLDGLGLVRKLRESQPSLPVVLMTAFQSLESAVRLVRAGASDYIAKPWDDDKLVATVKNLMRLRQLSQENLRLRASSSRARAGLASEHDLCGLIYESAAMHEVVRLAAKVAPSEAAVLVTGPNGSGKERIAQIVQANSRRKDKPFVKVNAGGLPDELLETPR